MCEITVTVTRAKLEHLKSGEMTLEETRDLLEQLWPTSDVMFEALINYARLHPYHGIPQKYFERGPQAFPQASPELMVLRRQPDEYIGAIGWQILLHQRPDDPNDPWPSMFHFPGTTLRIDDTMDDMMDRLLRGELGGAKLKPEIAFQYVTTGDPEVEDKTRYRERGSCLHSVYFAFVKPGTEFASGKFYYLDKLPKHTIEHHRGMIAEAEEHLANREMGYKEHYCKLFQSAPLPLDPPSMPYQK